MSESVHISSAALADLENVSVAFGISLLSLIEAKVLRYFICTSGNCRPSLIYHLYTPLSDSAVSFKLVFICLCLVFAFKL